MAFSADEIQGLQAQIDAALHSGRLNAWQTGFLTDIGRRIRTYGTETRLSAKQLSKLDEILHPDERLLASRAHNLGEFRKTLSMSLVLGALLALGLVFFGSRNSSTIPERIPQETPATVSKTPDSISMRAITVVDGDTIRVAGYANAIRLVGFNTPETAEPECANERQLGKRASARLKKLVTTPNVKFQRVPCACNPGTEGTKACNHGRSCGILLVDGRNVGDLLIREGLAVPFKCGKTSCPPTPRPWCKNALAPSANEQPIPLIQPKTMQAQCSIKGNVSSKGERIYHVPGQRYYNATRIDTGKGERWFCSESEARSAGWRRSKV